MIAVERRSDSPRAPVLDAIPFFTWRLGELTADERESISKYYLLQTDENLRTIYGDNLATELKIHTLALERAWQRVFINDAKLCVAGIENEIPEEVRGTSSFAQVFSGLLSKVFESWYPSHPQFSETLSAKHSASLIANFMGGADENNIGVQQLAARFAVPLGI
jgi:hypothetical protein